MKKIILFLLITITLLSCESNKPTIVIVESNYLPSADSVLIATPDNYTSTSNYPLVILLHGWSGNYLQWNSIIELQNYADAYNFIIACPDGFYDSWYLNNPLKPELQFEDFFWNDFIGYMTKNYSIDTNNIFISGLSMGGHGAMTLFLKNPDFFKSVGSTSGILDLTFFPDSWNLKDGIGSIEEYPTIWRNNSAIYLLDSLSSFDKSIIVDCGLEDFAYEVNLNFVKKCYDLGIETKFFSQPGNHNREHWKQMIPKHFEFFYKQVGDQQ